MNLDTFDLEYLLLTAIKSEIESRKLYTKMAETTQNSFLQDKLKFLGHLDFDLFLSFLFNLNRLYRFKKD